MRQPPPLPAMNPYAAPVARVEDAHDDFLTQADRGVRLAAAIVDGLILGASVGLIAVIMAAVAPSREGNGEMAMVIGMSIMGLVFLGLVITNMVLLHRDGQTIAKRLFGIKVVRGDGSRCELWRFIFVRWLPVTLLGMIPFVGWIVSLVDPLLIFRDDHRCLHDIFADTIVVKV